MISLIAQIMRVRLVARSLLNNVSLLYVIPCVLLFVALTEIVGFIFYSVERYVFLDTPNAWIRKYRENSYVQNILRYFVGINFAIRLAMWIDVLYTLARLAKHGLTENSIANYSSSVSIAVSGIRTVISIYYLMVPIFVQKRIYLLSTITNAIIFTLLISLIVLL